MHRLKRHSTLVAVALAGIIHAMLLSGMRATRAPWRMSSCNNSLHLWLSSPLEHGENRVIVLASPPAQTMPPVQPPPISKPAEPTPAPTPPPVHTPRVEPPPGPDGELEVERKRLQEELARSQQESAERADEQIAEHGRNGTYPAIASGSPGTIRELALTGWPDDVVDAVMKRYELGVSLRRLSPGSRQGFLSSAGTADGERYYSRAPASGIFKVFELSPSAVATMSALEEREIKRRQLDLERTQVTHVRFGIVQQPDGTPDLGLLEMDSIELP